MPLSKITAASITDNTITNTQINSSAAIAQSKLGALTGANMPSNTILQVQSSNNKTEVNDNGGNYNGVMMEVNITPIAASSKIFITLDWFTGYFNPNGSFQLNRAISGGTTTSLGEATAGYDNGTGFLNMDDVPGYGTNGNPSGYVMMGWGFNYLDTNPNTTSQITYKLQGDSIYAMHFNRSQLDNYGHSSSTITAMEIKG